MWLSITAVAVVASGNAWANSIRSVVEHAIGGIKRLALLSHLRRYRKQAVWHQIFIIGCGLHNLWGRFRSRAYARGAYRVRASNFLILLNSNMQLFFGEIVWSARFDLPGTPSLRF